MTSSMMQQGWVQSIDPNSGRVFYANHITRKTQWEPPPGWVDPPPSTNPTNTISTSSRGLHVNDHDENEPLPSNWEMMHDPTTGKPFYIDHERKITQWTRPKAETSTMQQQQQQQQQQHQPATAIHTGVPYRSSASTSSRNYPSTTSSSSRSFSYQQESDNYYYSSLPSSTSSSHHVDLSDTMPRIEFKVGTVSDALRPNCSNCSAVFSLSKRRHHCRLCGDIFCDTCSNHRVTLPLHGSEFDKPVRICDYCNIDVEQGNFFSMRRYLTVLHLYQPEMEDNNDTVATTQNVNAALSALTQDLDQMVSNAERLQDKVTIPPNILIPVIIKHLRRSETADRAIRCISSLLGLESLAGTTDYASAIYLYGKKTTLDHIIDILERSGSDRLTLFVQEQAARTIYYLTESKMIGAVTRKRSELTTGDDGENDEYGRVEDSLDIPRAIRNLLDHASASGNPNLQRWSAATLKNLIMEDQRRSCYAINEMAAFVASGEPIPSSNSEQQYKSHLPELVSTGGVMILGSLIGSDDADTRAHAITALGATIQSTRAVNAALQSLSEMSGGEYGGNSNGAGMTKDGDIVRAIVAAGGCAGSVAQLLLSADQTVAGMGCQFLLSLVRPLLTDPTSSGEPISSQYEYDRDMSNMGAYRSASIEIATGSCLPALLSLVRVPPNGKSKRPIELCWIAMETVTAAILSIGEMGRAWSAGQYEEGLERYGAPSKLKEAIIAINEEDILEFALQILQSNTFGQSLGGSVTSQETPAMRIRECAGIILSSITSCSAEAITNLQSRNILSSLLLASTDGMMTLASTIRSDGSPRCLGVLETVSLVLMFSWQHPSGSDKDSLDSLIEMIDAGALPFLSKVLRTKVDWESKERAIGGMNARIAACRFLCCLFGIALSDTTGIGMRRLMDAVESDASTYRINNDRRGQSANGGGRVPTNIVELTLGTLQSASNLARLALLGGAAASQQGPLYHSTVMNLVEASLLASGSMCGSSIAPGGSEGTLISGESFLESRSDSYVSRRQEICNVACDVVVRGGRGEPTLLPTMVVGGFGEGSVLASIRLALAIAQNGTKEQHAKLASSGILVPVSDLLRSALSRGDIYKFSSSLALVRFCGPYVAAGQGGGIEAVRDAIRVATNVLTLPANPGATQKQFETQETLKSECIAALEALSRNASLWSSISTEALPAVIKYIHSSALVDKTLATNARGQETKCAALRAILQIVQVPSHAVSAAEAGIVGPLGQLLSVSPDDQSILLLSLEVLHVIATNNQARLKAAFLSSGVIRSICAALGKSVSVPTNENAEKSGYIAYLGLHILHCVLGDIEGDESSETLLQSPTVATFLAAVASEPLFVQSMCASMLARTPMTLPRQEADSSGSLNFEIPKVYGPPITTLDEKFSGFSNTQEAAESLLFSLAVYACALASEKNDSFWSIVLLQNSSKTIDQTNRMQAALAFVAHFLSLLTKDHKPFIPCHPVRQEAFFTILRPLVCHRLLEALRDFMNDLSTTTGASDTRGTDSYLTSVLVTFNVPHICLSLWQDPALLDPAFDLIKKIMQQDPDEVLHLFVEGKEAIMSLFDLLNLDTNSEASTDVVEIRRFLASVVGSLAETGLLADAVKRYDIRSSAIAALATACLSEEQRVPDDDDDMTSNQLSSVLMRCLVELCIVVEEGKGMKIIRLSPAEAKAIASTLGKKLCHMVLSRFLERTKLMQYDMEDDENILEAPDVAMLCAVSQHDEALIILRSIGGLHALSLIAAEGEVSALTALKKACNGDADVLLEGDTYLAMMNLVASRDHDVSSGKESRTWNELESSAFDLLASLCSGSIRGRQAVASASDIDHCVHRAYNIVTNLVNVQEIDSGVTSAAEVTDDDEEGDVGGGNNDLETTATADSVKTTEIRDVSVKTGLQTEDITLGVAASSFLSSLAVEKLVHTTICTDNDIVSALSCLATSSDESLQFAAINLTASIAPYVVTGAYFDASKAGEILVSVMGTNHKINKINQIQYIAVCGISIIFDLLDSEIQDKVAQCITSLFTQSVKNCIVVRSVTRNEDSAYAVELSYALSSILLSFRGKVFKKDIFTSDIITLLLNMVQWKYDPKTVILDTESSTWSASVANCLLLLSTLLWRTDEVLTSSKINLQSLANTSLMLARPGKAPRKAIDIKSALTCAVKGTDSAMAMAAQRVLCRLYN